VFELCIKPQIDSQLLRTVVIKNTVWVLPAMLLVHALSGDVQVGLKEMFVTKVKWWRYLWVYALLAVWALLGGIFQPGGLAFELTSDELIIVLFVGITEEMVFRGWLLNATTKDLPPWLAILINAVLFMAIHFPRFIMEGTFIHEFTSFANVGLMIFSAILSISFLKSKNLLIPITMHMLYDLLMFVFGF
jgi:membrane protease YdiL (CAAX protease family)